MMDRIFWEEVKKAWIVKASCQVNKTVLEGVDIGSLSKDSLKDPWESDEIPFDMVDFDHVTEEVLNGFDPTADSLHVGHFMALCLMKRLQNRSLKGIDLMNYWQSRPFRVL